MIRLQNYINGKYVAPIGEKYFDHISPATGEVDGQVPDSDERDINLAVKVAQEAFIGWSKTSNEQRAKIMLRIADLIDKNAESLARAESADQGKPVWLASEMDMVRTARNFRYFANLVTSSHEESTQMEVGAVNFTERMPHGVTGLISPWNIPLYLLTWKIAPAIAMGNTAVCKPSELTSRTAFMLGEIFNEAGLPPGVVNIVMGTGARVGAPLTAHPDVPLISFTGGTETGKAIALAAAPMFKRIGLELGGKNPNIIFADADFDQAVATSLRSSFLNQGEICLCGSRIFVEESIYEKFLNAFVEKTKELKVGDPSEKETFMGPLVSKAHLEKVKSYIELAKTEGGTIVCGGDAPSLPTPFSKGHFLNPTIITGLNYRSRVMQEEIFGPVVTVTPFKQEDDVVAWANSVKYGLSASLWTKDIQRAHRVASLLQSATVWINCWMLRDLRVPFGGMKASGLGREGGRHSLEFFSEAKTVCVKY